jgi:tetratricopeptide (TPR) repeat protein
MDSELKKAILLRSKKSYKSAEVIFKQLIEQNPKNPEYYYHYAWLNDNIGNEIFASKLYEKAIKYGLKDPELQGCLLGLGSTYRNINQPKKSLQIIKKALKLYPESLEFNVFQAMTLFDLNQKGRSIGILLELIVNTSKDKGIKKYKNAIHHYAKQFHSSK